MTNRDASSPTAATVPAASATSDGATNYAQQHCFAVGISGYADYPRLQNATHDAIGTADILSKEYGFQSDLLLDRRATKANISGFIQDDLRNRVESDDLLVVFFAGHGHTEPDAQGVPNGYVVPVEAHRGRISELISMRELAAWSEFLRCRHLVYVFDSCFSGLLVSRGERVGPRTEMFKRRARICLTAGGGDEEVADGGWNSHSVFSGTLIKTLSEGSLEDEDGFTPITALFQHVAREVPRLCPQTPAIGTLPGHQGGDVLLSRSGVRRTPLVISAAAPAEVGHYSAKLLGSGETTRSSVNDGVADFLSSYAQGDPGEAGRVTLFASGAARQWVLIVGTNPRLVLPPSELIDTVFFDAWDALDWFINPDIFSGVPAQNLFFFVGSEATQAAIEDAFAKIGRLCRPDDSVLVFFSGHATEFTDPGELLLFDAFEGQSWGVVEQGAPVVGAIPTDHLVSWMNGLAAEKVVAIIDTGGLPLYISARALARDRFVLSSVQSRTLGRNGFVSWHVRRVVQKLGVKATLSQMQRVLSEGSDLYEYQHGLNPYLAYEGWESAPVEEFRIGRR